MNINSSYGTICGMSRSFANFAGPGAAGSSRGNEACDRVQGDCFAFQESLGPNCASSNTVTYIFSDLEGKKAEVMGAVADSGGVVEQELPIIDGMTVTFSSDNVKTFENRMIGEFKGIKADSDVSPCLYKSFYPSSFSVVDCGAGSKGDSLDVPAYYSNYFSGDPSRSGAIGEEKVASDTAVMHNAFIDSMNLDEIHASGITGKGVGVCVIDSGIASHSDLAEPVAWKDFTKDASESPNDRMGHGTMVAGLIAGQGVESHGDIKGIAPGVDLIGAKIGKVSEGITALQWAIENKDKYNIRVINISMGDKPSSFVHGDPWVKAVEKAVDAGIAVVVAAGNEGPDSSTITTPGTAGKAITVGALDDRQTVAFGDDDVAELSSRGPTKSGLHKPDVLAPGVNIISTLAENSFMDSRNVHSEYVIQSGSSLATPLVSGLCALLLQANPDLGVQDLKDIIGKTARPVAGRGVDDQGGGAIDPGRAVEMALAMKNNQEAGTSLA